MFRNVDEITNADCITIIDDKTIINFTDTSADTYKLISNTYILSNTDSTSDKLNRNTDFVCYSLTDVSELSSPFDFITPVYHLMAIISALFIFWFAYRLILYPFFRKR